MKFSLELYHRRSIRLKGYDYTRPGAYFITVCTRDRACLFGEVKAGKVELNQWGIIVQECWHDLPKHFSNVKLDSFVVMPNHVHGIVIITRSPCRGDAGVAPTYQPYSSHRRHPASVSAPAVPCGPKPASIGAIVGSFKSAVTRRINELRQTPAAPVWQRNYYEHIIRDDASLERIRAYIRNNPLQWALDRENPQESSGRFL